MAEFSTSGINSGVHNGNRYHAPVIPFSYERPMVINQVAASTTDALPQMIGLHLGLSLYNSYKLELLFMLNEMIMRRACSQPISFRRIRTVLG